jgi:hypothetical protein
METNDLPFDEFLNRFDPKITVYRLYNNLIPPLKIKNYVKVHKIKFNSLKDFDRFENLKLVWYKNTAGKSAGWADVDSKHIELKNENDQEAYPAGHKEKIMDLIEDFRTNGLKKDIEIISVTDSKLDEEIIVDGVHRAVAIYRCFQKEPDIIKNLLSSQHLGIYLINFRSPAASIFFPCDFLNFYRSKTDNKV